MTPHFSVDYCPICGAGLRGLRICGLESEHPHGLIVCDECEAIWTAVDGTHQTPDPVDARCPTCLQPLWGRDSRWAERCDLQVLGWEELVDPKLSPDADDPTE